MRVARAKLSTPRFWTSAVLTSVVALSIGFSAPAHAQRRGSVDIDWSVLDDISAPQPRTTRPQQVAPRPARRPAPARPARPQTTQQTLDRLADVLAAQTAELQRIRESIATAQTSEIDQLREEVRRQGAEIERLRVSGRVRQEQPQDQRATTTGEVQPPLDVAPAPAPAPRPRPQRDRDYAMAPPVARAAAAPYAASVSPFSPLAGRFGNSQFATSGPVDLSQLPGGAGALGLPTEGAALPPDSVAAVPPSYVPPAYAPPAYAPPQAAPPQYMLPAPIPTAPTPPTQPIAPSPQQAIVAPQYPQYPQQQTAVTPQYPPGVAPPPMSGGPVPYAPPPGPAMAAVPPPTARPVPGSLAGRFGNSQFATSGPVDPALLGYDASGQPIGAPAGAPIPPYAPPPTGTADLPPGPAMAAVPPPAARPVPGSLAGRFGNSQFATSGPVDPALLGYDASGQPVQSAPGAVAPQYPSGVTPPPMTGAYAPPADLPPPGPAMAAAPPTARAVPSGSLAGRFGNSQFATSGPVDPALLSGGAGAPVPQPSYPPGVTPPPPMTGGPAPAYAPPADLPPPNPSIAGPSMAAVPPPTARAAPGALAGRFGNSRYATSGPVDPSLLGYDTNGQPIQGGVAPPSAPAPGPAMRGGTGGTPGGATGRAPVPSIIAGQDYESPQLQTPEPPGARGARSAAGRDYAVSGPVGSLPPPVSGPVGAIPPPPLSGPAMAAASPPPSRGAASLAGRFGNSQFATSGPVDPSLLSGSPPAGDPSAIPPPPELSQSAPFPLPSVGGTLAPPPQARAEIPPPPTLMPDQRPSAAGSRTPLMAPPNLSPRAPLPTPTSARGDIPPPPDVIGRAPPARGDIPNPPDVGGRAPLQQVSYGDIPPPPVAGRSPAPPAPQMPAPQMPAPQMPAPQMAALPQPSMSGDIPPPPVLSSGPGVSGVRPVNQGNRTRGTAQAAPLPRTASAAPAPRAPVSREPIPPPPSIGGASIGATGGPPPAPALAPPAAPPAPAVLPPPAPAAAPPPPAPTAAVAPPPPSAPPSAPPLVTPSSPPPAAALPPPAPVVRPAPAAAPPTPPAPTPPAPTPPAAPSPSTTQPLVTPSPTPPVAAAPPAPPPAPTRSVVPATPPPAAAPPAAAPPAAPPAAAAPLQQQPQVAAAPPVAIAAGNSLARIDFGSGSTDLSENGRRALDRAVAELQRDQNARLQLVAYATGGSGDDGGSVARRVSLSRALAVRSYLIEQGIRATRMDVRALGSRSADGGAASDRVDVLLVRR